MMFSYNAINNLTKEKEYIEYETEIINVDNSGYHNPRSFCFKDKQGNMIEFQESDIASTFDGSPEVGATATVREYIGGFGYTSYEIVKIENEPKILP